MKIDDLRAHCLEVVAEINEHMKLVRDYAVSPGDSWLARNELSKVSTLMSDLEASIDAIKREEQR